ncbi:MAG: DUF6468 domain-containing protein [Lactobacillus sp.]|jgi:uncharacterized phage infection (PIP) family protein YhgE|nr:DUF6468 domain-containing protein [Lactobacillus sp.]
MDNLELLINLIIVLLLVPTIMFTYRLNKNLNILRQNQNSMAKLIQSLNDATFKAENSIPKLRSVTEHSSEGLKEVVDSAKTLKDDLMFINERANSLADRLEGVINDSRKIKPESISGTSIKEKDEPSIEDERSLAEMELLKALRSIK